MGNHDRPAILHKNAEFAEILDRTIHVDRRKARGIRQVYLSLRDGTPSNADGFKPNDLLAEHMGDALERRPLADIPFAEDAGLNHRISPQGEPEARKFGGDPFDIPVHNDTYRAISQRADRGVSGRQDVAMAVAKIASILKRENLAAAIPNDLVAARQALQQYRRKCRTVAHGYDVRAAPYASFDTEHLDEGLQFLIPDDRQIANLSYQRMHVTHHRNLELRSASPWHVLHILFEMFGGPTVRGQGPD